MQSADVDEPNLVQAIDHYRLIKESIQRRFPTRVSSGISSPAVTGREDHGVHQTIKELVEEVSKFWAYINPDAWRFFDDWDAKYKPLNRSPCSIAIKGGKFYTAPSYHAGARQLLIKLAEDLRRQIDWCLEPTLFEDGVRHPTAGEITERLELVVSNLQEFDLPALRANLQLERQAASRDEDSLGQLSLSGDKAKKPERQKDPNMVARDNWMLRRSEEGFSHKEILQQLRDHENVQSRKWEPIDSVRGIGKAIDRARTERARKAGKTQE